MLRITETLRTCQELTLTVEGRIGSDGLEELRSLCSSAAMEKCFVTLDFSGVSFVERSGIAFLNGLNQDRFRLINCSPFVREKIGYGAKYDVNDRNAR